MKEISLNILDIVQNAIEADSSIINIFINENSQNGNLEVVISDNGHGIRKEDLPKVVEPFFTTRTTRAVGLGIPLLKNSCEQTGGTFQIVSEQDVGTIVKALFNTRSKSCIQLGDIVETVRTIISCNPSIDFVYKHSFNSKEFELNTFELKKVLGEDIQINLPVVDAWIKEFISKQLAIIYGSDSKK